MPDVDGREGCWVGRTVEEVDGGVIRQGAVEELDVTLHVHSIF